MAKYTYKKGDTFGQVLVNMGLSDGKNLWGENGDVAYYKKQLKKQGIGGNIPIGTTISLTKRGEEKKSPAPEGVTKTEAKKESVTKDSFSEKARRNKRMTAKEAARSSAKTATEAFVSPTKTFKKGVENASNFHKKMSRNRAASKKTAGKKKSFSERVRSWVLGDRRG